VPAKITKAGLNDLVEPFVIAFGSVGFLVASFAITLDTVGLTSVGEICQIKPLRAFLSMPLSMKPANFLGGRVMKFPNLV
jgi:hypothetical protein